MSHLEDALKALEELYEPHPILDTAKYNPKSQKLATCANLKSVPY
jgi:hypothetical protein